MIVIDSGTSDNTFKMTQKYDFRLFVYDFANYANQRYNTLNNLSFETVRILFLDLDKLKSESKIEKLRHSLINFKLFLLKTYK